MLYIVEGPDNCGKDTLIHQMKEYLKQDGKNVTVFHFTAPPKNEKNKKQYQYEQFFSKFTSAKNFIEKKNNNVVLFNRSHLGEHVYARLYRNDDPSWITEIEHNFFSFFNEKNVKVCVLLAPAKFLINNDDGKSHSIDLSMKEKELELFKQLKDITLYPCKEIQVAKFDDFIQDFEFKDVQHITQEVF